MKNNNRKLILIIIIFIITYILNSLFPITLLTFYNEVIYRSRTTSAEFYKNGIQINKNDTEFTAYIDLLNSPYGWDGVGKSYIIIPFLLKYINHTGPYKDCLDIIYIEENKSIHGIKNIKITLKIDNGKIINIPIVNGNKIEEFDYSFKPKIIFPIKNGHKIDSIEYIVEFDGIVNGVANYYLVKNILHKEEKKIFGSFLLYIISQQ